MRKCWDCLKKIPDYLFRCSDHSDVIYEEDKRVRRPLTEHEKLKLSWYRSDKRWQENIRSRKIINGSVVYTDHHGNIKGEMPIQPRKFWPKPKWSQ